MLASYLIRGNITPCVSVQGPILGNIYENFLRKLKPNISCPKKNNARDHTHRLMKEGPVKPAEKIYRHFKN